MYLNYYSIPVFAAAVMMFVLALLTRAHRSTPGAGYFTLLMTAGWIYSLFYALEISSLSVELVTVFYKLEYLGIPFIPAFFLLFAISYTRKITVTGFPVLLAVLVLPVITMLMAVTHQFHDLFITDGYIDEEGIFPGFVFTPGPWYNVHIAYTLGAIILSIILLFRMWAGSAPAFRKQVAIVLAGAVFPIIVFLVYITGLFPAGLDPNPFGFAVTGMIVFAGISRFGLFRLVPLARNMLFDNIPDGVLVIDSESRLVDFNSSASAIFGINKYDIGRPAAEVFGDWPEVYTRLAEKESERKFEITRITSERIMFMDCYISLLSDNHGREKGEMLVVHDVTERRRAELEKYESEERFRTIFANAPVGIMYYDKNGLIEICNGEFINILGSSEEKLIGLNILKLPDRRIVKALSKALNGSPSLFEGLYTSVTGNKSSYVRVNFTPVFSKIGEVDGGLCMAEDITGRKESEKKIRRSNSELKRLNAEKDKFFSIIAHDLRSPFSAFLGYTDILAESIETMSPDMIQTIAVSMKESANNLYSLLENLLQWARMQQGAVNYDPGQFPVEEKILNCIEPLLVYANRKAIDVRYEIDPGIMVHADIKMFDTVVRNLFTNAVKFTPQQGSIIISAFEPGNGQVDISFRDTGIGMSPGIRDNLFRLDVKTNRQGTEGELSTGLGLILCREFIEMNGGSMTVESEEGKGSTFKVRLNKSAPETST